VKRKTVSKVLFIISALLLIAFVVETCIDYGNYNSMLNSAPFSVFILVNAIMFILPSAILAIIGFIIKRKSKQQNKQNGDK